MAHSFRYFLIFSWLWASSLVFNLAFAQTLPEKLSGFLQKHAAEKLTLVTNQQVYQAGDSVFFRVSNAQSSSEALIEVQLLGAEINSNNTYKVLLKNGLEVSYIILPANAASGDYILRAFSSLGWEASEIIQVFNPNQQAAVYKACNWSRTDLNAKLELTKLANNWEINWSLTNKPKEPKGWLFITGPNQLYYSQELDFTALNGELTLPLNAIPAKQAYITIAENSGKILDSYTFSQNEGDVKALKLSLNKTNFNRREQVELKISADLNSANPVNSLLAVRVVEQPDSLPIISASANKANEPYVLKRTLPTFDLTIIAATNSNAAAEYIFVLKGHLLSALDKNPAANSLVHLLVPATNQTEVLYADKEGRIQVELDPFEQTQPILFRAIQDGNELKNLLFSPDSSQKINSWPLSFTAEAFTPTQKEWLTKIRLLNQIKQAFYLNAVTEERGDNKRYKPSLFQESRLKPTTSYELLKYEKFSNVTEIFRELIPAVEVVKRKDGVHARLYARLLKRFYNHYPLFLIDGIPTYDVETVLNMPADHLVKIDVFNTSTALAPFDVLSTGGVIALYTKNRNFSPIVLHDNLMEVTGTLPTVKLAPQSLPASTIPNFNPAVFWDPLVKTDANGVAILSFVTTDQVGRFAVEVTTTTPNGEIISALTSY